MRTSHYNEDGMWIGPTRDVSCDNTECGNHAIRFAVPDDGTAVYCGACNHDITPKQVNDQ